MKFFTPERFVKLQESESAETILEANEDWERAVAGYRARLEEIAPRLPSGPARLVAAGSLHDAAVVAMWNARTRLTILLQEDGRPGQFLLLSYSLIDPPYVDPAALPERFRSAEPA